MQIGNIYMNGKETDRDDFIREVTALPKKSADVHLRNVLQMITEEQDVGRKLEELEFLIYRYSRVYVEYTDQITRVVERALDAGLSDVGYGKKSEIIYRCYQVLRLCEQEFGRKIQAERKAEIKNRYIQAVFDENHGFVLSDEQFKQQFVQIFPDCSEHELVRAFYSVWEMRHCIETKKKRIFEGNSKYGTVQLERIPSQYIDAYLYSAAEYCGQYWMLYDQCPDITEIFSLMGPDTEKRMYDFFKKLLMYFLKNPNMKGKKQVRLVVDLSELTLEPEMDLYRLNQEIPGILVNSDIRRSDILKVLDKDIEDMQRGKMRTDILHNIRSHDLQSMRGRILEAYEQSSGGSIVDGMKNGLNNFMSLFGRKK